MKTKFSLKEYLGLALIASLIYLSLPGFLGNRTPVNIGGFFVDWANAAETSTAQTINLAVSETITLTLSTTTLTLPALTPGSPVFATSSATTVTNSDTGWRLQVKRDSTTSTLAYGATSTFPDATAWDPTGNGNATTTDTVGANLHLKVANTGTDAALYNSTWWGPNDSDGAGNAKYAGHPTPAASKTVAQRSTYATGNQVVVLRERANSPADQRSGTYTGTITITAITGL